MEYKQVAFTNALVNLKTSPVNTIKKLGLRFIGASLGTFDRVQLNLGDITFKKWLFSCDQAFNNQVTVNHLIFSVRDLSCDQNQLMESVQTTLNHYLNRYALTNIRFVGWLTQFNSAYRVHVLLWDSQLNSMVTVGKLTRNDMHWLTNAIERSI